MVEENKIPRENETLKEDSTPKENAAPNDNIPKEHEVPKEHELAAYGKNYSADGLKDKLTKFAKKAGLKTVYATLLLYYVLDSDKVSKEDKLLIIGALGYLILPVDLIPDVLPVVGFADDFGALIMALRKVWLSVTPEIKAKAKAKLHDWFDSYDESELEDILK